MDIELAKTFLEIIKCGSLISAAEKLHVTQTAITARVKRLESYLNCRLFVRNKSGAQLTSDGQAFTVYASRLIQTWEAALRDLPLPEGFQKILHIGAEASLTNPLVLGWVSEIQKKVPLRAIKTHIAEGPVLLEQLELGLLDVVLVYHPAYWPGLQVEQVLEEKLILVRVVDKPNPYVYVDWGPTFRQSHDSALPDKARSSIAFNIGPFALQYILNNGGSGYFRASVVQHYIESGVLERIASTPEFSYPTYLVYTRDRLTEELKSAIQILKEKVITNGILSE